MKNSWLKPTKAGLYCIPGQFYIDPIIPQSHAIITHAHSDHVCHGNKNILATKSTNDLIKLRSDQNLTEPRFQSLSYHKPIKINDVKVTLLPAGHIIGSAQIMMEYNQERIIVAGDYKRTLDPTCEPFFVKECDLFVTEATFGLPIFQHPNIHSELKKLLTSLQEFPEHTHLMAVYALGKCQRVILGLRELGYNETIYMHGALQKICAYYRGLGFDLGKLAVVSPENAKNLVGEIVLCPMSALHDRWTRKLINLRRAYASGWMRTRARAKQKHVELPLVISDHADWQELTETVLEVDAPEVWVMHGDEEALLYFLTQHNITASALPLWYDNPEEGG